ncbi:MAG: hypothetical protein WD468_09210 [Pirellulales bacterium]
MRLSASQRIAAVVLIAILISGCSKGRPVGDVRGTVTVNGQPLSEGAVRFVPVNGDTPTSGGIIRDGKFQVEVPIAKQRVEISANVVDEEKTPPNPTDDQIVMKRLVPQRYNTNSDLTLDVVSGVNEPVFNLDNP